MRQYSIAYYNLAIMQEEHYPSDNPVQQTSNPTPQTQPPKPAPISGLKKHLHSVWEVVEFAVIALLVVIPIRTFVAQPFVVSGSSMVPTFQNADYLIVDEISYRFEEPARGDVIIFKYPKDQTKYFIKRVIGLPGETVVIQSNIVTIKNNKHPDGFTLSEPYVKNISENYMQTTLKDGEYFVMGDNRAGSSDSRFWGTLPRDLIIGRAFVRLLPIPEIDLFPGEVAFTD